MKFLLGGKPRERLCLRIRCNSEGDSKGWIEEELDLNFLHLEITLGRFCFGVIFIPEGKGLKRMRRSSGEVVSRLVTIALLSALGFVLMAFARIPYPPAPWLMIELSEITVLIAYAMYGLVGGVSVAIVKTALDMTVHGPTQGLGIGNITALFTSLMFVLALFVCAKVFQWFNKGLKYRIFGYITITLFVTVVLTGLNALFITPSYLTVFGPEAHFSTCFDEGAIENVISYFHGQNVMSGIGSYFGLITLIYGPFNLLKAGLCCFVYELVFNRLIFVFMQRSTTMKKYFLGNVFTKEKTEEETTSE